MAGIRTRVTGTEKKERCFEWRGFEPGSPVQDIVALPLRQSPICVYGG